MRSTAGRIIRMRSVAKLILTVAAMVVLAALAAGPAVAAVPSLTAAQVGGSGTALAAAPTTADNAPAGPNINQQQHDADAAKSKNKLVIGVIVVALLVVVYFGHRQRAKHRVRKRNLQNAKG